MSVDLEALEWKHRHDGWLADPQMAELFAEVRALRAERDALAAQIESMQESWEGQIWKKLADDLNQAQAERDALRARVDDLTKFLAECCLERDALRAKNKALGQQFLDADGYVVELRARCAELERAGRELYAIADSVNPATYRMELEAWRQAVRGNSA